MERILFETLLQFGIIFGIFICQTESLSCYQCNVYIRGSPWPCDSERGMKRIPDCFACLKTYTKTTVHNTFHDRLSASYESRVCVKDRDYVKSAGCHNHETDSGYMKRCFCFDDYCNSSFHIRSTAALTVFSLLIAVVVKWIA